MSPGANIKLDSVLTDVMGKSGRAMIEALIASETNPAKLARLADRPRRALRSFSGEATGAPANVDPIVRLRALTDVNGAMWLTERARSDPGERCAECPQKMLRTRKQLVREQSSHVLRVRKTLEGTMTCAQRLLIPGIDRINSRAVRKGPRLASTCASTGAIAMRVATSVAREPKPEIHGLTPGMQRYILEL